MKVLLDIKDSKADFVLELLNDLAFVKVKIFVEIIARRTERSGEFS